MTLTGAILNLLHTSYAGIDNSLSGNGGIACYDFLSFKQRLADTSAFTVLAGFFIVPYVLKNLSLPKEWEIISTCRKRPAQKIFGLRKVLLITLCIVLGIEIGYKLSQESWIFLLNPCHVITAIQIYLLSAEPSRMCTAVFRSVYIKLLQWFAQSGSLQGDNMLLKKVHIHLLFGALLAFLFPVLNTRLKSGEQMIYWLQHFIITFVVPPYLIHTGGAYRCEPIKDYSWALLSVSLFGFYMYYILQPLGMITLVNLNNMLCPAISDPFSGPHYRWFAIVHQTLLILTFGKIYTLLIYVWLKLKDMRGKKFSDDNQNCFVDTFLEGEQKKK